jgi:glycosyltransferase involved in cell wall biosynthesis
LKKRVLSLIKGLGRGGAEQLLASGAPHINRARFDYEVAYLLPWKDALVKELADSGVVTHCLDGARGAGWVHRLRRLVSDGSFDLVHAHSPVAAAGARLALSKERVRIVYTEHNVWARYHPLTRWSNILTFGRNAHVFAVSDEVRGTIRYPRALSRLSMPTVETLYHGIDPAAVDLWTERDGVREELGISAEAPVVGTVANLKTHKRLDRLMLVADRVRRRLPDVRFVVVGRGALEGEIKGIALSLGLDDTVIFTGFREDAPRMVSAFDVFALSSDHEGLPISLIEAMALGKPVVLTRVGGIPEVIEDGRQGYLVAAADVEGFGRRVIQLLEDPALRSAMGAEGRIRAQAFDVRLAVARMEQVYEELLS